MELHQWKQFVDGIYEHDPIDERKANVYIVQRIMDVYHTEAKDTMQWLTNPDSKIEPFQRATLTRRFAQIQELIIEAFHNSFGAQAGLALAS